MNTKTKSKIKRISIDNFFEIAGWFAVVLIWGITLVNFSQLPDKIPTHFNFSGDADGFGHKSTILLLPIIAIILYLRLNALVKSPHTFNYPFTVTENNVEKVYFYSTRMLRYLKFILMVVFNIIVFRTIEQAKGNSQGLGTWFLPLVLCLTIIPVLYFLIKMLSTKN